MAITRIGTNPLPTLDQFNASATRKNAPAPVNKNEEAISLAESQSSEQTNPSNPSNPSNPDKKDVQDAVDSMNEVVSKFNNALRFSVDEDTGNTIVKIVDTETKEVIKQIPSEEMVAISKAVDKLVGLLVQQKT